MSTIAPTAQPQDADAKDARIDEIFAEDGFAKVGPDGDIIRLKDKVAEHIATTMLAEAVAAEENERLAKAIPGRELYPKTFRHGPDLDDPDEFEREVAKQLSTVVTSLVQPNSQGRVQKKLASIEGATDLVLCRRTFDSETGPCYYLTRSHELIVQDYVTPATEKVVKTAGKYKKDMDLVVQRQPGLEQRVTRELEATVAKTAAELGVTPSLEAGRP